MLLTNANSRTNGAFGYAWLAFKTIEFLEILNMYKKLHLLRPTIVIIGLLRIFNGIECEKYDDDWWKYTKMYQLVIPSFKDSDGDGMGDINGIISKLDYLKELGFDSIWITPFFKTSMTDMGYDISDYNEIDPRFGTLKDFQNLIHGMKNRKMKLIVDFVINHSSDEHPWFQKSIDRIKPYDDYYIWKDAIGYRNDSTPIEPNNWKSVFRGSMWQWNAKRQQFYLHQFAVKQPDLNLRNSHVKNEVENIIAYWFKLGASGLRLDAPLFYMEDRKFRNLSSTVSTKDTTHDLWESYEFIHEIRTYVDRINQELKDHERIIIPEARPSNLNRTWALYGTDKYHMSHYPFNFNFISTFWYYSAYVMQWSAKYWFENKPKNAVTMWVADSHDNSRIGDQLVLEQIDIVNIVMMMLPGAVCIYYGQEVGMVNAPYRLERVYDRLGYRDRFRSPMQWDDSMNAGFTRNIRPWVQMSPNYWRLNVEAQKKQSRSHYQVFKDVSNLKNTNLCKNGSVTFYAISAYVFAFTRISRRKEMYITLVNVGAETKKISLNENIPYWNSTMVVVASSVNSEHVKGDVFEENEDEVIEFSMKPLSALVLYNAGKGN